MKNSPIKRGTKPLERRTPLNRGDGLKRTAGPKRSRGTRRTRTPAEKTAAVQWHMEGRVKNGGVCVRVDCDQPADHYSHHILGQSQLHDLGLRDHLFDEPNACPACRPDNLGHSSGGTRITRDDLIATDLWDPVVEWARDLDARYWPDDPGHQPVLSRLERDYPAGTAQLGKAV